MKKLILLFACMLNVVWASAQFSGSGNGTESDPYLIMNVDQLAQVSNYLGESHAGVVFKLMKDLDMSSWISENNPTQGWLPVGVESSKFMGKFYGNNHKLTGLMINRGSTNFVGLFGYIDGATISDLSIELSTIVGNEDVGSLVGRTDNSTISNCSSVVSGGNGVQGYKRVGGLIGYSSSSTITSSKYKGKVTSTSSLVGGFMGYALESTIKSSSATADVTGNANSVAGFCGMSGPNTTSFSSCSSTGSINGKTNVGGFVASVEGTIKLSSCSHKGNIKGTNSVGGIIGTLFAGSSATFSSCHSQGTITNTGDYTGGVVGRSYGPYISSMANSSHFGDINGKNYVGGLIGSIDGVKEDRPVYYGSSSHTTNDKKAGPVYSTVISGSTVTRNINNCTSIGNICGTDYVGGLVGKDLSSLSYVAPASSEIPFSSVSGTVKLYKTYNLWRNDQCIIDVSSHSFLITYVYWSPVDTKNDVVYSYTNSYFSGNIQGTSNVGGIAGYKENGDIQKCYAYSTVQGASNVGGIIGTALGSVVDQSQLNITLKSNVAITSNISATSSNVGRIYGNKANDYVTIGDLGSAAGNRALAIAKVSLNGIVQEMTDNFQNGTSIGNTALKLKANYVAMGWDFNNDWDNQETESYPYKRYQTAPPVIESDLVSGATTVSGKSVSGGKVYFSYKDKATVSTESSGNNWSFTTDPLQSGAQVRLYAEASNKVPSYFTTALVGFPGSGTEADPYRVYSAYDLQGVFNQGYYKLMNDIDLTIWIAENSPSTGWVAIGRNGSQTTYFDGNGHNITGLWINSTENYTGLFSNFSAGQITNLTVEVASGKKVKGGDYTGILIGRNANGKIENCVIKGDVEGTGHVGGVAGVTETTNLFNVSYTGSVTSSANNACVGGMVGLSTEVGYSAYRTCRAKVNVQASGTGSSVGGIAGKVFNGGATDCVADVTIKATGSDSNVGGLFGWSSFYINTSSSKGSVQATGNNSNTGGLVGYNSWDLVDSYSTATTKGTEYTAGLVGYSTKPIVRCYASGNVQGVKYGAGLVGELDGAAAYVSNCFAVNNIINLSDQSSWGSRVIGGYKNGAPDPDNSNFALSTMQVTINNVPETKTDDIVEGIAKSQADLFKQTTYSAQGWDFTSVWAIDENSSYPYLQAAGLILSEMTSVGNQNVQLERLPSLGYEAETINVDFASIANALGCSVSDLKVMALTSNGSLSSQITAEDPQGDKGYWLTDDGKLTYWEEGVPSFYVYYHLDNSTIEVGHMIKAFSGGEKCNGALYVVYGDKYYAINISVNLTAASGDYTSKIVNPTFDNGDCTTGWSGDAFSRGGNAADGAVQYGKASFCSYQTITDLASGWYRVGVQGFYRSGTPELDWSNFQLNDYAHRYVDLFATTQFGKTSVGLVLLASEAEDEGQTDYEVQVGNGKWEPNQMQSSDYYFNVLDKFHNYLLCQVGEDGKLTIGIEKSVYHEISQDWTNIDNWTLEYLGKDIEITPQLGEQFIIDGVKYEISDVADHTVMVVSNSYSGNVVIPATVTYNGISYTVTAIEHYAFANSTSLSSVQIPEGMLFIAEHAFENCTGLKKLEIPSSVIGMQGWVAVGSGLEELVLGTPNGGYNSPWVPFCGFQGSTSLKKVTIYPGAVNVIHDGAFLGCVNLEEIIIPADITNVGGNVFNGCSKLSSITCCATTAPALPEDAASTFVSVPETGTLYVPSGADYSSWLAVLGEGWTVSAIESDEPYTVLSDMTSVGSQQVSIEREATMSYLTSTVDVDFDAVASLLGCEASEITVMAMSDDETLTSQTTANDPQGDEGYWLTTDGIVTGWAENNPSFFVYYDVDGNNIKIGHMENAFTQDATCAGTIYAVYKNKYYAINLSVDIVANEGGDEPIEEIEPSTDISTLANTIYIPDMEVRTGDAFQIPIYLKSAEEDIIGFQFDLYIPDGIVLEKNARGSVKAPTFNAEADRTSSEYHTISAAEQEDGSIRVLCYSNENELILGTDGIVCDFNATVSEEMAEGDYNIIIKNICLTKSDITEVNVDKVVSKFTVPSYILGDVNYDKKITVTDIACTASYILGTTPDPFVFKAADVNTDERITVTDIAGIANIILTGGSSSAVKSRAAKFASKSANPSLEIVPFTLVPGTTSESVPLELIGEREDEFVGFQCDIYLPAGISWKTNSRGKLSAPTFNTETERTSSEYHTVSAAVQEDGSIRVLCYSTENWEILGKEGAVIDLPLTFDENLAPGVYDIIIRNTELTNTDIESVNPGEYKVSVLVGSPDMASLSLYGDFTSKAIAEYNTALEDNMTVAAADLTGATNVSSTQSIVTGNKNLLVYVNEGTAVANTQNVVEGSECENLVLTDKYSFNAPKSFTAAKASYARTASENYGTIVLPFVPTKSDAQFYEFTGAGDNRLEFTEAISAEANVPYLYMSNGQGEFTATNAQVAATPETLSAKAGEWTFVGTYADQKFTSEDEIYAMSSGSLYRNTGNLTVRPFRGYFTTDDASAVKSYNISIDGNAVSIDKLENETEAEEMYDLSGRKVNAPAKGIYIVNKKKVLVK